MQYLDVRLMVLHLLAGARVGEAGQVGHADVVLHLLPLLLCLKSIAIIYIRIPSGKCGVPVQRTTPNYQYNVI
jgi:hypothetical protein